MIEPERSVPKDDKYGRAFYILTEAFQEMTAEGITKQEAIPALVDFAITVGLIVGGAEAGDAICDKVRERVAEWKAGNFPVRSHVSH